ncbi:MAG: hypothetical protein MUC87_14305 [Bacteroidia bacterium]|jgi:hypothetical protein|nr:hypothetical protein [Bacteroidia bacterium]
MIEYFKSFPLVESASITRDEFEKHGNGYIKIINENIYNGIIIEKKIQHDTELVTFLSDNISNPNVGKIATENYTGINYEIEQKISSNCSIIQRFYIKHKQTTLIVRQLDSNGIITAESSFENGQLLQYDEIIYGNNYDLKETRTFLGKNAWIIEKEKY